MLACKSFEPVHEMAQVERWVGILCEELAVRMVADAVQYNRRPRSLHLHYRQGLGDCCVILLLSSLRRHNWYELQRPTRLPALQCMAAPGSCACQSGCSCCWDAVCCKNAPARTLGSVQLPPGLGLCCAADTVMERQCALLPMQGW